MVSFAVWITPGPRISTMSPLCRPMISVCAPLSSKPSVEYDVFISGVGPMDMPQLVRLGALGSMGGRCLVENELLQRVVVEVGSAVLDSMAAHPLSKIVLVSELDVELASPAVVVGHPLRTTGYLHGVGASCGIAAVQSMHPLNSYPCLGSVASSGQPMLSG